MLEKTGLACVTASSACWDHSELESVLLCVMVQDVFKMEIYNDGPFYTSYYVYEAGVDSAEMPSSVDSQCLGICLREDFTWFFQLQPNLCHGIAVHSAS